MFLFCCDCENLFAAVDGSMFLRISPSYLPSLSFSIPVTESYAIPTRQTKISHFDPLENGKEGAKGEFSEHRDDSKVTRSYYRISS